MANARTQKERSKMGLALSAGIGVILAAHIPSRVLFRHGSAPIVALAAGMLVLIVVATRFTSVRQGLIYGSILGLLSGVSSFMGMDQARQDWLKEIDRALAVSDALVASAKTQPAATTQPTTQPLTEDEYAKAVALGERLVAMKKGLPYRCILPHVVMGTVIGGIFAQAAVRRRHRTDGMW